MDSYSHEALETHPTATVLVVDDEPAIREVIATLLEDEGYLVRHAKDGLEALDAIIRQCDLPGTDQRICSLSCLVHPPFSFTRAAMQTIQA